MASFNKNTPVPSRQLSVNKNSVPPDAVIQELFDKFKFLQQDLLSLSQKVNELPKQTIDSSQPSLQEFQELLEQEKYKNDIQEQRLLNLEMQVKRLMDKR